ncbi:MAG: Periplasmic (Fe) hydrogenase large subunit [Syntrophorhabdaceae bacterium PtaU1.Bin034]|jgi:iron only hydrogenase large subunit-like protein|nr:MAG: Periplasmic (Fe) hydrogenase large subunit [Syntrophorhabdaceae bacterium PtaU1.Bin034]
MGNYFHSVTLDEEKCRGCTNCIKRCPVEAIRVHWGKAKIIEERCIDCGECIRCCPNHAKIAITDTMEKLAAFEHRIVLPAPSFFGQFREEKDMERILEAFLQIGFDEVFEVALAAEVVASMVGRYLETNNYKKPLISSACPAIIRLMQIKFPDLLEHVAPIMAPMEVAARLAKEDAAKRTGLPFEKIGAFFISPCPAKVTEVRQPLHIKQSAVDGAIGASVIYKELIKELGKAKKNKRNLHRATSRGIAWGYLTGESRAIGSPSTLSTGGVKNATDIFEEIERGSLKDVDFIEVQACEGGCVGGPLNIQNIFVARVNLKNMVNKYKAKTAFFNEKQLKKFYEHDDYWSSEAIQPRPIMMLDDDVSKALMKMERLDAITASLPGLDCGACGSPNCRALAEDITRGLAFDTDCIVNLRERVKTLAEEILDLARKLPQTMANEDPMKDKKNKKEEKSAKQD